MTVTLANYDAARHALIEARSIDEVKDIRDRAEALRQYMRQAGESLQLQNDVAEIKLRAERRAGELLQDMEKHPAGRPTANPSHDASNSIATLSDLGVTFSQSSRWQTIARIPEEQFDQHIARIKGRDDELTTAGVLRFAKDLARTENKREMIDQAAMMPTTTEQYRLICGNFAYEYGQVEPASIDAIITDPPYPFEYLSLYKILAEAATVLLKPFGSLLVMVGQSYLPEVLALMSPIIRYHWTLAYLTPGGQAVQLWQRKVNTFWKPVLWFVNGVYPGPWVGDVTRSAVNDNDKRFHDWGQSESGMADLVERFTLPGQTVLDPFCGAGTTGVVAVRLGRQFIGIDIDQEAIALASGRLGASNGR